VTKPKTEKPSGMKTVPRADVPAKPVPPAPKAETLVERDDPASDAGIVVDGDIAPYYRQVCSLVDSAETMNSGGWGEFWRMVRGIEKAAREGLVTAEKMNDVLRMQSAIQFVDHIVEWYTQRVTELNGWAKRSPLFAERYCYEARLTEADGVLRVTVVNTTTGELIGGGSALPSEVLAVLDAKA